MSVSEFNYLIEKILSAEFSEVPFRHIEIEDFFSAEHFAGIVTAPEIRIEPAASDEVLCNSLLNAGWVPIQFPGGTTSIPDYLAWRKGKSGYRNVETCEGFGIVFRLAKPESSLIARLDVFLRSESFLSALAQKFEIDRASVVDDGGIQKYLDGYEISPHPDIRTKALTFMVNINPHSNSEEQDHHTHYLVFNDKWRYIQEFWRHNPQFDRAWVPWSWCRTIKQQVKNNSIVIFSPSSDTMHAVRARYDHLKGQRTQLYGNLWYGSSMDVVFDRQIPQIPWQGLEINESRGSQMVMTTATDKAKGGALRDVINRLRGEK